MPYKCSVKGCHSNYDSTSEKVSVFRFPSDPTERSKWARIVNLDKDKIGNSSRVCIKHFAKSDVATMGRRSLLKMNAAPRDSHNNSETSQEVSDIQQQEPEIVEAKYECDGSHVELENVKLIELAAADIIDGFAHFCEGVEEMQESVTTEWNIYSRADGVCFYQLGSDENFNDVNISFKILINNHMRVKLFRNDQEASTRELKWILTDCHLQTWTQFKKIIEAYQQAYKQEIIVKKRPMNLLGRAFDALDEIREEELQHKVDSLKDELTTLYELAKLLPDFEEDFYNQINDESKCTDEPIEDEAEIEPLEEFLDPEVQDDDNAMETFDEGDKDDSQDMAKEESDIEGVDFLIQYENGLQCENCLIILKSEHGFRAHQKSCTTNLTNLTIKNRGKKPPEPSEPPEPEKVDLKICDICGKSFGKGLQLQRHMRLHNESLRQKCPHCDILFYVDALQRHIRTVHDKLKPYKCSICSKAFSTTVLRNDHEKIHEKNVYLQKYLVVVDGSPRYSCPKCSTHYETSTLLKKHIEKNCRLSQKKRLYRYPCSKCLRTFTTKLQAANHLRDVHQIQIVNIENFCFECNEECSDYVNHVRSHSCNFACSFCGSKFLTNEKVLRHEESKHSFETVEDRPFKCPEKHCGTSFKNIHHLKSHQKAIHTQQEREFQCSYCEKKFGLRAHLTVHERQHFIKFPCNFHKCERNFKKLSNLKEHLDRDHGIQEIYLCNLENCGERFKLLTQLKHHRISEHQVAFNIKTYFENHWN